MNPVGVDIRNVALAFGATQVLRDITVSVAPGEFFALLGPSGSGKSTLLRLIAGFNRSQQGEVLIGGRNVTGVPPWKRNVGMVFQSYALWPHMTVAENVAFGLEERRLAREEVRRKVAAALDLVGLAPLSGRRPNQLSGGQQQRVAIARTLAIEPQVLLLDEPLSNLDAKLREQTRRELVKLQRRLGITTIFVTHDQIEALTTCDRIAVMDQGVIQQVGTPQELFDRPVNRFVARFVGSVNLIPGTVQGEGAARRFASEAIGVVALPPGLEIPGPAFDLAFRPHAARFLAGREAGAGELAFDATIEGCEFLGEFLRYELRAGGASLIADIPHARGSLPRPAGTPVRVAVPASELRAVAS